MKSELNVRVEPRAENGAQVMVSGSMDAFTFDKFQKAMTELTESGTMWIVIDLRRMTYVASVGINFLINLRVQRRKVGGEVILVAPQPSVVKIFKMLGLLEVLITASSNEEAWIQIKSKINPSDAPATGVPLIE